MALAAVTASGKIVPLPEGEWETINKTLERTEVPGGWIYRSRSAYDNHPICFVPRPAMIPGIEIIAQASA